VPDRWTDGQVCYKQYRARGVIKKTKLTPDTIKLNIGVYKSSDIHATEKQVSQINPINGDILQDDDRVLKSIVESVSFFRSLALSATRPW